MECYRFLEQGPLTIKSTQIQTKVYVKRGVGGGGGVGTQIWNRRGCSSEILNLTPKGDHLGVAQGFCDPERRPIWLKQILTPKRDPAEFPVIDKQQTRHKDIL